MHARIGWQGLRKSEFLSSGNYYIITGTDFDNNRINLKNISYISKDRYDQDKNIQVHPNDILLTKDGTIGKVAYVDSLDKPATLNAGVYDIKNKSSELETKYLFHYLTTNRLLDYAKKSATGGTIKHLNQKILVDFPIEVSSKNEEKNIANLLDKIDKIITLQQRKLDELTQIKEGIGQGLLNRHYRNLSIRFNRENSPWKQTKLGKIASFVNGRAFKQKELMNRGLYPVLRVGNFYTNNKWYYSNLNLSPDKYANKGDLLYTWSASFGPHVWKGPKVIYHYHIWKINFDPAVISKAYLYEFLKLDKKEILANSNGSTMIHITKKDMENKMITVPDMNEQIKIGKILEKLDLKIELNKNKLNNLKSVKQFLLQKMFM